MTGDQENRPSIPAVHPEIAHEVTISFFACAGKLEELNAKLAPSFISITKRRPTGGLPARSGLFRLRNLADPSVKLA
jgi:hypothetical protein